MGVFGTAVQNAIPNQSQTQSFGDPRFQETMKGEKPFEKNSRVTDGQ